MALRDVIPAKRGAIALAGLVTVGLGICVLTRTGGGGGPSGRAAATGPAATETSATATAADAPRPEQRAAGEGEGEGEGAGAMGGAEAGASTVARVDHVAALRRGLASDDEATRIAAVEAAASATAIETLADLERFELARDPEAAPTVIHAVALLGASAEGPKRDEAAGTLQRWLTGELRREGPDVAGNVSNIVEALGNLGASRAADALIAALDQSTLALHVQTLAVMKLGELGDGRARAPVERFATRVAKLPAADGIDEELRVEAIEAARATLSRI